MSTCPKERELDVNLVDQKKYFSCLFVRYHWLLLFYKCCLLQNKSAFFILCVL